MTSRIDWPIVALLGVVAIAFVAWGAVFVIGTLSLFETLGLG